ncbi:linear amide C-N hydrolase [Dokdonella sp.]|uniref:linear amide C-N hydrolase n=1 Tax=Dokdonella sp. TaxID=2291710 RepID=UPI003C3AF753
MTFSRLSRPASVSFKALGPVAAALIMGAHSVFACTGIVMRAQDGTVVPGRTMEFGFDMHSNIIAIPAGTKITTLGLDPAEKGFTYSVKYGFLGANGLDMPIVFDGMNSEGLYFGALYFAGDAVFGKVTDANRNQAVSSEELGNWILGQFATVQEVRAALPSISIVGTHIDAIDSVAPFHYAVTDATGASIVVEYTKNGLHIHDNTVNVITNNPPYDWHLTNLRNYIGLHAENNTAITVGKQKLLPFGQGTGMAGLPGDFTSPSRFVRAVAFANASLPAATGKDAVFQTFHVLNAFDIPKGAIRENDGGNVHTDYTIWASASDTKSVTYYYKTYLTQAVESIDVRAAVSSISKPTTVVMEDGFRIHDRTSEF